jgi:hypothetical protein
MRATFPFLDLASGSVPGLSPKKSATMQISVCEEAK